jgi:hypothetical protein
MKHSLLFALLIITGGSHLPAQLWSGILAPSRAVDWSSTSPGVVGGIPSATWPQCASSGCQKLTAAGASATVAQINAAIASAPAKTYVLLQAGTYLLSGGVVMAPNVALRGAGPDKTFLVFSAGLNCNGEGSQICIKDSSHIWPGMPSAWPGGGSSATFCGTASSGACNHTYNQGATTIQLSGVGSAGIANGQYIYLDQVNDNPSAPSISNKTGMLVCDNMSATDGCSLEGGAPGRCSVGAGTAACVQGGNVDRNLTQIVRVVSGCKSACKGVGPFSITITPGLYGLKWNSLQSPGAWWPSSNMQNAGIEDLSIDSTAAGRTTESAMMFFNAFNCWVSNVRSIKPNRSHVWFWQAAHISVQNSYFFGTQNAASQSYGVESFLASDNLVINNIFQQVTAPIMLGPSLGSVFAYNFTIHDSYVNPTWMMQAFFMRHDAGALYNLSEGNLTAGYGEDVFHGTGGANTAFRNYAVGWESGKTGGTVAVQLSSYNRFENFIGNVLGCNNTTSLYPGNCGSPYHTKYASNIGVNARAVIYDLGAGNGAAPGMVVLADPYVTTSLMRWGNYDVVHAGTQWSSSEVPSGLTDGYANPVPASEALPASFWTRSKPSWWGSVPWPAIGPDVTGGSVPGVGGHVYLNPAANCYLKTMGGPTDGTGSVLRFSGQTCYDPPPRGLTGAVH